MKYIIGRKNKEFKEVKEDKEIKKKARMHEVKAP